MKVNSILELKELLKGCYPADCDKVLEETENILAFENFKSQDALKLGTLIVELAERYEEEPAVRIIRMSDNATVFQYIGNNCTERNIAFAMAKLETVRRTGHCSLWAMAREQCHGDQTDLFQADSGCLPVGGAFPVYVNGEMTAIIALSGLHDGNDHPLLIGALCRYLGTDVPEFRGMLI